MDETPKGVLCNYKGKTMITSTYQDPLAIKTHIELYGFRYTFWYLTEMCNCTVSRTVYLILLSI